MIDFSEVIDLFKQGQFDIDCKEMVLQQNKASAARFTGQGYIRQAEDGTLNFKIYVSKIDNTEPHSYLKEQFGGISGKIPSSEMFYDLAAMGRDGRQWTTQRIRPAVKWDASDGSAIATGQVDTLSAREPSSHPRPYMRLHFFEEYEIPVHLMTEVERRGQKYSVLNKAEFEALESKFEVRNHGNDLVIEVDSDKEFPRSFHLRVQEALQYLTAKPAFWRARIEVEGKDACLELASPMRKSLRTRFHPPLSPALFDDFVKHGWKLFACFLAYVIANTKDTYWNPVAYHLHNACEASANSIDAQALGFSVAVEALAGLVAHEQDDEKAKRVAKFQDRMRECLATQSDFADLKPRMEGLIDFLSAERVKDKLRPLAAAGQVDAKYIKAWDHLRNRHVHPKLRDLRKPDAAKTQELVELINKTEVLLRQVTFYLIGYTGPFTDYGAVGFPSKRYPLTPPESANDDG